MDGKRVLVTGGAGFIGSNVANHLASANEVIAIDDERLGTPSNLDSAVDYRHRDVRESDLPTDVDVVVHLAAMSSYGMHESAPVDGVDINVGGFVNTVEQARDDGCDTVVYASTSSVYGSRTSPSAESEPVTARTAYEASKLSRERYANYFASHYNMQLAGMRFFSVYQGYGGAEAHKGTYANVIAQFADDIAHGRRPELYGDGTQSRDFTHVDDVVRAIELAASHELSGVYNVGTGRRVTFTELVAMLNDRLGTDVEPAYVPNPIPESVYVEHTLADASKFSAATGWEPTIELEDGIDEVCAAYVTPDVE